MPSYIPNSFELTDISTPNDNKEIYVKLTYSSKNNYFKITQNKNTKYTITGNSIVLMVLMVLLLKARMTLILIQQLHKLYGLKITFNIQ